MNDDGFVFSMGALLTLVLLGGAANLTDCRMPTQHQSTQAKCAVVCYEHESADWEYAERAHVCTCSDGRIYRMGVVARPVRQ